MSKLKKGDLVKAWDDDPSEYVVGKFVRSDECSIDLNIEVYIGSMTCSEWFANAVKIPDELAKQLKELK